MLHHGQKFQADEGVRTLLQGRSHAPMLSVEERRKAVRIDVGGKYPGTNIGRRIIFYPESCILPQDKAKSLQSAVPLFKDDVVFFLNFVALVVFTQ